MHLGDWPDPESLPADPALVADMDRVRDVCSTALAMRRTENVRVRQPLRSLTIAGPQVERLRPFLDLIQDEVNVKEVRLSEEIESLRQLPAPGERAAARAQARAGDEGGDRRGQAG